MQHASGKYAFGSFSNDALTSHARQVLGRDAAASAELLAVLGEMSARRLHAPLGYRSLWEFCVRGLGMPEDMAAARVKVARAARRFPLILEMIEDRRLSLTGAALLVRRLTPGNARGLLDEAADKSKDQIRAILARRFPEPDVPTELRAIGAGLVPSPSLPDGAPTAIARPIDATRPSPELWKLDSSGCTATASADLPVPERVNAPNALPASAFGRNAETGVAPSRIAPLAPERFALQVTLDQEAHDLLRYAQSLLGPGVAPGDLAEVLKRALAAYTEKLERQKLGVGTRASRGSDDPRYVPVAVRREVWERDGGQCTFESTDGHRCEARDGLHFDHVQPVGKGGEGSSVANVRLLCATHNRLEADRVFGAGFMQGKVDAARACADERRAQGVPRPDARNRANEAASEARIASAARDARARGRSPADVLQSHEAARAACAELDRLLARAG